MKRHIVTLALILSVLAVCAGVVEAGDLVPSPVSSGIEGEVKPMPEVLVVVRRLVKMVVFGALGLLVLLLGLKVVEWVTPLSLKESVGKDGNTAAALVFAAALIALGLVLHASITGLR